MEKLNEGIIHIFYVTQHIRKGAKDEEESASG